MQEALTQWQSTPTEASRPRNPKAEGQSSQTAPHAPTAIRDVLSSLPLCSTKSLPSSCSRVVLTSSGSVLPNVNPFLLCKFFKISLCLSVCLNIICGFGGEGLSQ